MAGNNIINVCSHKRSGTHFLLATLWKNFELPDVSHIAPMHAGKKFVIGSLEWMPGSRARVPWGNLWATHNFYSPNNVKDPNTILYIVRNPINTLKSYRRFLDPLCKEPDEKYFGRERIAYWYRHAKGYTNNCRWIRYEDLAGSLHDRILDQIAEWYDLDFKYNQYMRVEDKVGYYPSINPVYKDLPDGAIELFREIIPPDFLGYKI